MTGRHNSLHESSRLPNVDMNHSIQRKARPAVRHVEDSHKAFSASLPSLNDLAWHYFKSKNLLQDPTCSLFARAFRQAFPGIVLQDLRPLELCEHPRSLVYADIVRLRFFKFHYTRNTYDAWEEIDDPTLIERLQNVHFKHIESRFGTPANLENVYNSLISYVRVEYCADPGSRTIRLTPEMLDDHTFIRYAVELGHRPLHYYPGIGDYFSALPDEVKRSPYKQYLDKHLTTEKYQVMPKSRPDYGGCPHLKYYNLPHRGIIVSIDVPTVMKKFRPYIKLGNTGELVETSASELGNVCLPIDLAVYSSIEIVSDCPETPAINCHFRTHPLKDFAFGDIVPGYLSIKKVQFRVLAPISGSNIAFQDGGCFWYPESPHLRNKKRAIELWKCLSVVARGLGTQN